MKILVFDTCLDKMYVTLADDGNVLTSKIVKNKDNKYHSAFLISTVKDVLKENHITPANLGAIGTNIGPGSFTGIRACTTVARMMAQQLNLPAVGVSSLEILSHISNDDKPVIVALDARKNSAYLYLDNKLCEKAVNLDEVNQIVNKRDCTLITDDRLQKILGGISYQQKEYPLGDILAKLVYLKLQDEKPDWRTLKPLYIQPPPQI